MPSIKLPFLIAASAMLVTSSDSPATDHNPADVRALARDVESVSCSVDIEIHVEEAVTSEFAGFFSTRMLTVPIESDSQLPLEARLGTLAVTFDDFTSKPVGEPIEMSGLFVSGRNKIPTKVRLTLQQRDDDRHAFDAKITGISNTSLTGVAVVDSESITMRLQGSKPQTTVLVLHRQPSPGKKAEPSSVPIGRPFQSVPSKPFVSDGRSAY